MANEFVARRGIIAQSGGAKITGSLLVSGTIDATGFNIIANSLTGSFSGSIGTAISASFATTASAATSITFTPVTASFATTASAATSITFTPPTASFATTASFAAFAADSVDTITVTNNGSSAYLLDGVVKPVVTFVPGTTYRFNTSGVVGSHPFRFSLTANGPTEYTYGVTVGTGYTEINVDYATSASLFYYCTNHSGMGNAANTLRSENLITAAQTGSMSVLSSSYASTASVAISASFATTASAANSITFTPSTASFAVTASFATNATIPAGTVSSSTQFNTLTDPFTGSFTGSFTGDGSGLTGIATVLNVTGSTGTSTVNLKTQALTINGGNGITTNATEQSVTVSAPAGTVSASSQIDYNSIQNKLIDVVSSSAQVAPLLPAGTVSSSGQVVVQNTTGIGALATTGSNIFTANQIITGSLFISQNLTVFGSSSISYISQSVLNIGTNKITVNVDSPAVRFGGLDVIDSGSSPQRSGSILFDSINDQFIFVHANTAGGVTSSVLLMGPPTFNNIGNETLITQNRILKGAGLEHITDSQISDDGITVSITNGLSVGTNLTASQADITTLRATSISASVSGALTGTFPYNSLTSIPSDIVSSSAQVASLLPANTVSSSAQVQVFLPDGTVSSSAQYPGWVTASSQIQLASITGTTFAASNFTFPQQLTVSGVLSGSTSAFINNTLYSGSAVTGIVGPVSNQVVASIAAASCDGVFFDYVIKDGTNYRTGTVMVVSNGTIVEFTDTSTNDIGNTAEAIFTADISGGLIRLKFTNSSGTWTVKTVIRAL